MKRIILLIYLSLISATIWAKDFTDKQKAVIYSEAIKMLQSYQDLSNQLADAVVDLDESNKLSQKVIDLFVNRKAIIYNDLDPAHKLSDAYELETYITNMLLWYPDGMKINFDFKNLKAGNVIDHGNDIYTVDLMTSKKIDGNYLNKQKNEQAEELLYRIAFFQKGNEFENYKIAGVRSSKTNNLTNDANTLAEVKSVQFSEKDMGLIIDQSKALLNDYINFINLLADPKETSEDKGYYRISFMGLFKDTTQNVANDLEPDPQKRWIPVTDYEKNLVTEYPDGIRNLGLNLDSAQYGKVIPEGTNKYYINGYIDKFFSGKYQDKVVHRDNSKYDFKISFERDDNTFKNFKLASIDKFGVNLYDQDKNAPAQELPQMAIKPLERHGLYYGLNFGGGMAQYMDKNLTGDEILKWKISNKASYSFDLNATAYFTNRIGVNVGIGYSTFSCQASIDGEYQDVNERYIGDNTDGYYKIIDASIDSTMHFGFVSIPVSVILHSNKKPEEWGFYAQIGLLTSICTKSTYKTSGYKNISGYFPTYPEENQYVSDVSDWGFTNTQINNSGKIDVKPLNFSAIISLGVSYPIDYFTTVFAGPELMIGQTNLYKNSSYTDLFGNNSSAQKIGFTKYGIKFGISYKF